ncbi:hypothetical protein A8M32_06900 [Sinorhizobium alkalisoli]|uniref:Uncharacterized protein n=1 Tax=Sinorhizobium alkalisoli TaxID=1752398 RepID=A0A1E3VEZ0_9HYPH|nr:hypothetical protein A8M32_06900 [Sinorhizobium alkalisoli]
MSLTIGDEALPVDSCQQLGAEQGRAPRSPEHFGEIDPDMAGRHFRVTAARMAMRAARYSGGQLPQCL